jgi:hypothetical protein
MNRKIFAVAAAHAKSGPGAGHARCRSVLLGAEGVGEEARLWRRWRARLLPESPQQEVEQTLGKGGVRHGQHGPEKDGGSQQRPAPQGPKTQLCTQRLLHPTQHDGRGQYAASATIHHNGGW